MSKRQPELYNVPQDDDEELGRMSVAHEALRVVKRRIMKPVVLGSLRDADTRIWKVENERGV